MHSNEDPTQPKINKLKERKKERKFPNPHNYLNRTMITAGLRWQRTEIRTRRPPGNLRVRLITRETVKTKI